MAASACAPDANGAAEDSSQVATPGLTTEINGERLLRDLSILAHDSMEGRRTGTPGNERARAFLLESFPATGLQPLDGEWTREFSFVPRGGSDEMTGVNILGVIRGSAEPELFVVVTAHYDHLGIRNDEIYNGADDNASGTAALLELARSFAEAPPRHSLLFVALDAEEMGLQGARTFVANPPVPVESIVMNVNLDMISRSEVSELYAVGTYHYPALTPLVEEVAGRAPVNLLMGHDTPDLPPGDDWTMSSDHGPFHQVGIPFIYFGVEDHPGYHAPSDVFEDITPDFYVNAVRTIRDFLLVVDREGHLIRALRP